MARPSTSQSQCGVFEMGSEGLLTDALVGTGHGGNTCECHLAIGYEAVELATSMGNNGDMLTARAVDVDVGDKSKTSGDSTS